MQQFDGCQARRADGCCSPKQGGIVPRRFGNGAKVIHGFGKCFPLSSLMFVKRRFCRHEQRMTAEAVAGEQALNIQTGQGEDAAVELGGGINRLQVFHKFCGEPLSGTMVENEAMRQTLSGNVHGGKVECRPEEPKGGAPEGH